MSHIIFHYDNGKTYKATKVVDVPELVNNGNAVYYAATKASNGIKSVIGYTVPTNDLVAVEYRRKDSVHVLKIKKNRINIVINM